MFNRRDFLKLGVVVPAGLVLSFGFKSNSSNLYDLADLIYFCAIGNTHAAETILGSGVSPNSFIHKNEFNKKYPQIEFPLDVVSPILMAADRDQLEIIKILFKFGAFVDLVGPREFYQMSALSLTSSLDVAKTLVRNGANIDYQLDDFGPVIGYHLSREKFDIFSYLVKEGANINGSNFWYGSGIVTGIAMCGKSEDTLRKIMETGYDVGSARNQIDKLIESNQLQIDNYIDLNSEHRGPGINYYLTEKKKLLNLKELIESYVKSPEAYEKIPVNQFVSRLVRKPIS